MAARKPGRPRRDLPPGIGEEKDAVIALQEGCSEEAIRWLRHSRGIPPATEPNRSRWAERHGRDPDEVIALVRAGEWD
jgi:hypothetical protein